MFTRKARQALRKARQQPGGDYVALLIEGEKAFRKGLTLADNPYRSGDDAEIWQEGFEDARDQYLADMT